MVKDNLLWLVLFVVFAIFFINNIDHQDFQQNPAPVQDITNYVEPELNGSFLDTIGYRVYPSHPVIGWIIAISIPIVLFCFVDNYLKRRFGR